MPHRRRNGIAESQRRGTAHAIVLTVVLLSALTQLAHADAGASKADSQCPDSGVIAASDSEYGQELIKAVTTQAFYLDTAAKGGQTGTVIICLRANRDRTLAPILIDRSSGYAMLDGSALYATGLIAAKNAGRMQVLTGSHIAQFRGFARSPALPAPPDALLQGREGVWIRLPISFQLSDEPAAAEPKRMHLQHGDFDPLHCQYAGADVAGNRSENLPEKLWADYGRRYVDGLGRQLFYPSLAVAAEIEGQVEVDVVLRHDNSLVCAAIARSSGDALLDGAALVSVGLYQADGKAPPIPTEVPADIELLQLALPINFEIR